MNEPSSPVILAPNNVTVTGMTVLVTLSDGTVRQLIMTEKQAAKTASIVTHKIFGGRLKLSAQPVQTVQASKPAPPRPSLIVPG